MSWMLILVTYVCIIRRCRPNDISTLVYEYARGILKQDISLKGTEELTWLNSTQLNITEVISI
ncbi:hypothetical protein MTR67_013908 [Solanum verrucosum]|uniref:Uncharacterized protein n=1 Tax=Solanum verrucosum TaxID=315347 RepID=A0AAF0QDF1_SOLVR|nr:hypothetical protein MTR67_013908 [Solanum verrucosum]